MQNHLPMLHIANPIYDSLFKYLMEDERIAMAPIENEDIRRIVTRLLSAASDTQVRHSMNIEEEINTALENRDTEIMLYKNEANEAKKVIAEKDEQLSKKDEQLSKQSEQLSKKDEQLVSAIRLLHGNGMSQDLIASSLGINIDEVAKALI